MSDVLELEHLADKYNDAEYTIPYQYFAEQHKLNKFAFMIITPDAIKRGLTAKIMKFISEKIEFKIKLVKEANVTNRQLELLYKYAFKRKFLKGELVYWWLLQESWSVGPCVAMLLYSSECMEKSLIDTLLELKGDYHNRDEKTIRTYFNSTSMIMNVIHSSDDSFNMIREASLFFSNEELINVIKYPQINNVELDVVNYMVQTTNQYIDDPEKIINVVLLRAWAKVALECKIDFETAKEIFVPLIEDLSYKEFTRKIASGYSNVYRLLTIIYALIGKKYIPIQELEVIFDTNEIMIDSWEKVVIKNILLQKIWTQEYT